MENRRLKLHQRLIDILGSNHVYYQPPENIKLEYPAIVYSKTRIDNRFADNSIYKQNYIYQITIIDYNPDSEVTEKIAILPNCLFQNSFASDGLNHDIFNYYL